MLFILLSLIAVLLVARLIIWVANSFWNWLGGGKEIDRLAEDEKLSQEVAAQVSAARAWRTARRTERMLRHDAPHLTRAHRQAIRAAVNQKREEFLDTTTIGVWQMVIIFVICSILGLILEEIWILVTAGFRESRAGLVWGPFSPLYGVGGVLFTYISYQLRRHHATNWQIFIAGALVGGLLEQVTGMAMELLFQAQSWSYAQLPDHITEYVAWRFLFMWGCLGLAWTRLVMPELLYRIGVYHSTRQYVFVVLLTVYLVADVTMTFACFERKAQRDAGIPATNPFAEWVDEHYDDKFISERFQNLVVGENYDEARARIDSASQEDGSAAPGLAEPSATPVA